MRRTAIGFLVIVLPFGFPVLRNARATDSPRHRGVEAMDPDRMDVLAQLRGLFVENHDKKVPVRFSLQGGDRAVFLRDGGVTVALVDRDANRMSAYEMDFDGEITGVCAKTLERSNTIASYFRGPAKEWKAGLRTARQIIYEAVWPGIDVIFRVAGDRVKYDLRLAPGSDPSDIRLRFRGVKDVRLNESGELVLDLGIRCDVIPVPVSFEESEGCRNPAPTRYEVLSTDSDGAVVGLRIEGHDVTRALLIDPVLFEYCGYIGGADGSTVVRDIAVDDDGFAYVTGQTSATEITFPVRVGPDLTFNDVDELDAFVAKVTPDGSDLVYCGYLGGDRDDLSFGIAVDTMGAAYVTGFTLSDETTFPVLVGPDLTFGGSIDCFVAKVVPDGSTLEFCGYIGGSQADNGWGVAVDGSQRAYVGGTTLSDEATFPVIGGPDVTFNGTIDAFVARLSSDGTTLEYCGYVGGDDLDFIWDITVDSVDAAYCAGSTYSDEATFPVLVGPSLQHSGGLDAFITKVSPDGMSLVYSGFVGGSEGDEAESVAIDENGYAYLGGQTSSPEASFPVKVGPDLTYNFGSQDGFVCGVTPTGDDLAFCGYVGGDENDWIRSVAVDRDSNVYVAGPTESDESTFPVVLGPDLSYGGARDAFVAMIDRTGACLDYSGYIGGIELEQGEGIAVSPLGTAYVVGFSKSDESSFPVIVGPDITFNGIADGFVARVSPAVDPILTGCRAGGVNALAGGEPDDVLFVNGGSGDFERKVRVLAGSPITVYMKASDAGPIPGRFALYLWLGEPNGTTVTPHPKGVGSMCFPTPLKSRTPQPRKIWNNIGKYSKLGVPGRPSSPAPSMVENLPSGIGFPITVTFQGFIADNGSVANLPASITNAVTLVVQ